VRRTSRFLLPALTGVVGASLLTGLYFAIVSLAESPSHAVQLFWEDRAIVLPIILGFGVQVALYTVLKKRLFVPVAEMGPSGALTGASGGMSAAAMVACCAHHAADVLPLVGLTAAATLLAEYRIPFMLVGLGTTIAGIAVMSLILFRERRKALSMALAVSEAA
jgi:hypothetical protein